MVSIKKIFWLFLAMMITLSAVVAGCAPSKQSTGARTPTPTPLPTLAIPSKPVYTVERGEIIDQVIFSGRIVPIKQQELYFKVGGRVRKVYVQEGDDVKAGTVLADLEAADGVSRAQALRQLSVKRAQIRLDMAKVELEHFKTTGPAYSADYQKTLFMLTSQVDLAQVDLDEANMGVEDITKTLTDAQIVAPFDGRILSLNLEDGKLVQEFAPLMVMGDVNTLEISADPTSDMSGRLSEKLPAAITSPDETDKIKPTTGVIRRMPYMFGGTSSDASSKDKTIRISMDVTPQSLGYKLGDLVKITIVLRKKADALILPSTSIRNFEGRTFVVIKNGAVQERVDVKVGITDVDKVEILEGLKEGMQVIAP